MADDDPQLPEDVLIEILIRLPVKSILKLRCVSKTWRDLIRSPVFIHRYQNRESKQSVLLVKRYMTRENGDEAILSFHEPDFPELLVSPNLSIPVLNDLDIPPINYARIPIYGPCNGIVCVPLGEIVFFCNPALREFKLLPPLNNISCPEGYVASPLEYGFGFDPNTGAYKLIQMSDIHPKDYENLARYPHPENCVRIDLYNSATNSWKQIDAKLPIIINYMPSFQIFFSGKLHWYAAIDIYKPYILCFDTSTEAFRQFDFPDDYSPVGAFPGLMVLDESLAMVRYPEGWEVPEPSEIEIWVMKEYGVKESWSKQFVIGPYMVVCPLLFLNNEWLLVESDNGRLAVCALHENQLKGLPFYGFQTTWSAVVYEESLIGLDDIISSDCQNELV